MPLQCSPPPVTPISTCLNSCKSLLALHTRFSVTANITTQVGITVSGRLQSWYDPDGSTSRLGVRTMIGSAWAKQWWKYNNRCVLEYPFWQCPLDIGDSSASLSISGHNQTMSELIAAEKMCINGGNAYPCPLVGKVSHFGTTDESIGLDLAANASEETKTFYIRAV